MGILSDAFYIGADKLKKAFVKVKGALARFFQKALELMRNVVDKLATKLRKAILGSAHFFRKVGNRYQEGTKNYWLEEEIGQWNETIVVRGIELEDVPPQYRTMEDEFEIDDTQELDAALSV